VSDDRARDVIREWERGASERTSFMSLWQDVTQYTLPDRADYTTQQSPGARRTNHIYDSTAPIALQEFAAGLHSMLTSPDLPWFTLNARDDAMNEDPDARAWLDVATQRMYAVFASPNNNFAAQSHELFVDLGSIGTACMAVLDSRRSDILFTTRHMRECVIRENDEDQVDRLTRRWEYTARQAHAVWGDRAGKDVVQALDKNPDQKFWFLHRVGPRSNRDRSRQDAAHLSFESLYVAQAGQTVIAEGGFHEFPYVVPRFAKSPGEVYGRSPAMTALPDIKMANEMAKTILKAGQMVVEPPLQVTDDGFLLPIRVRPGGLIFRRQGVPAAEPLNTGGRIDMGENLLAAVRQQILRGMYVQWMLMPSDLTDPASNGKGVTATYVLQQRDEKMRLLSPMVARMQGEFLGPLIRRVFAMLWRQSVAQGFGTGAPFPQPPPALSGLDLDVVYVSPLAIAQRSARTDTIARLVQTAVLLMQIDPRAARTIDAEAILRLTARDLNAPSVALKSRDQVQAEIAQEQQAAAAAQGAAQLGGIARAAKDGTSALGNLLGAVSGDGGGAATEGAMQGVDA
jgi:hypothetical protein